MGYQEKTHVVAIVRLVGQVGTGCCYCVPTYIHTCTWMDIVLQTVDDGVGENTYTLCRYLPDM